MNDTNGNAYVNSISTNGGTAFDCLNFPTDSGGSIGFTLFDVSTNYSLSFNSLVMYTDINTNNFSWTDLANKSGGYSITGQAYADPTNQSFSGNGGTITFAVTPEPSTYALLCISLGVVGFARKRLGKREW